MVGSVKRSSLPSLPQRRVLGILFIWIHMLSVVSLTFPPSLKRLTAPSPQQVDNYLHKYQLQQQVVRISTRIDSRSKRDNDGDDNDSSSIAAVDVNEDTSSIDFVIRKEIAQIVDKLITECNAGGDSALNAIAPNLLVDNAHILVRGRIYEEVMQERALVIAAPAQQQVLDQIDALIRGFITTERKNRARLKINYLLAGAQRGKLEYAIQMLSESEEIDDDLMACLDVLIRKELMRAAGSQSIVSMQEEADSWELEEALTGVGKEAVNVLRMLQRRLRAEREMGDRVEVRLLAALIYENDPDERIKMIRKQLRRVEDIDDFYNFIAAGIDHMSEKGLKGIPPKETTRGGEVELSSTALEKTRTIMREVEQLLEQLKTGLLDSQSTYSTIEDDYLPN